MTEMLMAGCGIKRLRWERALLILTGGVRDSLKLTAGYRKSCIKNVTPRTTTLTRQCQDKYFECGGVAGWRD